MKKAFLVLSFLSAAVAALHAAPVDKVLVAGFQNLGADADANINIVLTKSLISWLSRLSDVKVVSYDTTEQTAAANGFWKTNAVQMDTVEMMGLKLGVQKIVYGNYLVNQAQDTITVNYTIYDMREGIVLITRTLNGPAGMDVFDTIDAMAKKVTVAVVSHDVDFAALSPAGTNANETPAAVIAKNAFSVNPLAVVARQFYTPKKYFIEGAYERRIAPRFSLFFPLSLLMYTDEWGSEYQYAFTGCELRYYFFGKSLDGLWAGTGGLLKLTPVPSVSLVVPVDFGYKLYFGKKMGGIFLEGYAGYQFDFSNLGTASADNVRYGIDIGFAF